MPGPLSGQRNTGMWMIIVRQGPDAKKRKEDCWNMTEKKTKNVLVPGCGGNSSDKLWDAPHSGAEAASRYLHVNRW